MSDVQYELLEIVIYNSDTQEQYDNASNFDIDFHSFKKLKLNNHEENPINQIKLFDNKEKLCEKDNKANNNNKPHDIKKPNDSNTLNGAKKKKTSNHEESNNECNICQKIGGAMISCDMCSKPFHFNCINLNENNVPKGRWYCEKCREIRDFERKKRRREQRREKKTKKDIGLNFQSVNRLVKKDKCKEEYDKKFQEFCHKYPHYIQNGNIRFPIEDKLFSIYPTILQEYYFGYKKPLGKIGVISPNLLGDILQIWDFFHHFTELFKFEDLNKEIIYLALKYEGDRIISLLYQMHQAILNLFWQDFLKRNKYEVQKDEQEFPFLKLLSYYLGENTSLNNENIVIWTEIARNFINLPDYNHMFNQTSRKIFNLLATKTALGYNTLDIKTKIKILLDLIQCAYETNELHKFIQVEVDNLAFLNKRKIELLQEIKQGEIDINELKIKIEQNKAKMSLNEGLAEGILKNESLTCLKEIEQEKNEIQQYMTTISNIQDLIAKKKDRIEKVDTKLITSLQSSTFLGLDVDRHEYWHFLHDSQKIYVRHQPNEQSESAWYFYDKLEEIELLIGSLNSRGIREKALLENLYFIFRNKLIAFTDDNSMNSGEKFNQTTTTREPTTQKKFIGNFDLMLEIEPLDNYKSHSLEEEKGISISKKIEYWTEKMFEYQNKLCSTKSMNGDLPNDNTTQMDNNKDVLKEIKQPEQIIKELELDEQKYKLLNTEQSFNEYLRKMNCRWTHPRNREEIRKKIQYCQKIEEFSQLLLTLNEKISYCEKMSKNEDDILNEVNDQHKKTEELITGAITTSNDISFDGADDEDMQYKRINLRLWGINNEKLKKYWINFTSTIDNLCGLYFSIHIFCDIIQKYIIKKKMQEANNKEQDIQANQTNEENDTKDIDGENSSLNDQKTSSLHNTTTTTTTKYKRLIKGISRTGTTAMKANQETIDGKQRKIVNHNGYIKTSKYNTRAKAHALSHMNNNTNNNNTNSTKITLSYKETEESENEIDFSGESDAMRLKFKPILNKSHLRRSSRNMIQQTNKLIYDEGEIECNKCERLKCDICKSNFHSNCSKKSRRGSRKPWLCATCLSKAGLQRQTRSASKSALIK